MVNDDLDWDEVLVTKNPDSKEVEVSFKLVDGDGSLIGGGIVGDLPGTPPGVTEDADGCTNTVRVVSDDTFVYQDNENHWIWLVLRSMPSEYMEVDLQFTDGTMLYPEYTTQTLTWPINPGNFESDQTGLIGKKVPLVLGTVNPENSSGNYFVTITGVRGFSTGDNTPCFDANPVSIDFAETPAIVDPTPTPDGGPIPGNNPECEPHDCTAYDDYLATNGSSNILRTVAFGPSANQADATGWNIPTSGIQQGEIGSFATGGDVISDDGTTLGALAHLKTFDGVLDTTTFGGDRVAGPQRLTLPAGSGFDDLTGEFGCEGRYILPVRFGTVQNNEGANPSGAISSFEDRGANDRWVAWGENPYYPSQPANTKLFDVETPYNEILLVEPWEHAEFLVHAVSSYNAGWDTTPAGAVPDGGKLKFLAGNGGKWTNRVVAGNTDVGDRASAWYGETYCTLDYENETMTLTASQIDPDSIYNPTQNIVRTWNVPREFMTNCWVKSRMTVTVKLRPAPGFFIPEAHFIEYTTKVEVSLGNYITAEVTNKGRVTSAYCSSPYAENNPGNFSKYYHPDPTGAGDNVNYVGISERGLSFGEQSATYQGTNVTAWTLAATLGNAATNAERTAWARQWKTYTAPSYCQRIP